jgi:hypothetical protein
MFNENTFCVYEGQLCCTKSSGAAMKELQGSYEEQRSCYERHGNVDERHEVYEEQRGCYEGHGMDERLFAFNR